MAEAMSAVVARACGIPESSAKHIASSAANRYKVFYITKRGGKGLREVAQPAREVKAVQRIIIRIVEPMLTIHPAAMAYVAGKSIISNAAAHASAKYLLKLDFSSFFPSIDVLSVSRVLRKAANGMLSDDDIKFVLAACLWTGKGRFKRSLCIGAPSSPLLSNAVMFDFDRQISDLCKTLAVTYTRYSDDLTFSSTAPNVLSKVEAEVERICATSVAPSLTLNREKTVARSRKGSMSVTGLTLSNSGSVTVGRIRKRGVRSGVNDFINGKLEPCQVLRLKGELAFVLNVEPTFAMSLFHTYGSGVLQLLPKPILWSLREGRLTR